MGADIARGIYIRVVNVFFYFGSLSKIAKNAPGNKIEHFADWRMRK
jgi:hypothetical protein